MSGGAIAGAIMMTPYTLTLAKAPDPIERRHKIARLESVMLETEGFSRDCPDCPVTHFKAPGMYARQMLIPKGQLIIGKIHKHAHLNHITYGHVRVETEHGPMEIKGPHTFTSKIGTKRAVVALEDTLWTTFHLNPNDLDPENEADMRQLEDEIIAKSYDELDRIASHKEALPIGLVRGDFLRVLAETGRSAEWVRSITENTDDLIDFPDGFDHLRLAPSTIEGTGLFTDIAIESGAVIGPARIDGKRTPLGRYANHSPWPNVEFRLLPNGDLESIALHTIQPGEEIVNDYRQGAQLAGWRLSPAEVERTQALRQLANQTTTKEML